MAMVGGRREAERGKEERRGRTPRNNKADHTHLPTNKVSKTNSGALTVI
jgi:hypothetical protein